MPRPPPSAPERPRLPGLLCTLIERSPDFVGVADRDGELLCVSRAGRLLLGLDPEREDLTGSGATLAGCFPQKERPRIEREVLPRLRAGEPFTGASVLCHAQTGACIPVELSAFALPNPDAPAAKRKDPAYLICTARDVTAQLRTDTALGESRDHLRALLEETPDTVFIKDRAGRYRLMNPAGARVLGKPVDQIVGRDDTVLFPEDEVRAVLAIDRQVMESGQRVQAEEVLSTVDSIRTFAVTKTPFRDSTGRIAGVLGIARDITEQRRAQAALQHEEARFSAFMDHSPAVGWITDADGKILYVSNAYSRLIGLSSAEVVGRNLAELFPADLTRIYMENIRAVVRTGRTVEATEPGPRADGTRGEFLVYKFPLPQPGGSIAVGGVAVDVTALKRAEAGLRLREQALRAVESGILITEPTCPDNPIVFANPGFERLTGYPPGEILGRNCRFLQGPGTDPATVAEIRRAVRERQSVAVEILNYRKDGTPFWNALTVSPIRDEAGQLTHFVGVQTDVTERRQLEAQFHQAQKMEALGRLAGGVAHDFNNLLTIIAGYGLLLLEQLPPGERTRTMVSEMIDAGDRAAGLTRQLLSFSRKARIEPQVLSLKDVVGDAQRLLRRVIGEDIDVGVRTDPDVGRVRADSGQLSQILLNLAVNARDAMPRGGKLTIEVRDVVVTGEQGRVEGTRLLVPDTRPARAGRPGRYALLAVSDTGHGIPADVLPHIWEPFFTTKEAGKGTGLGLAVVHGLVEQAGGHATVYSEVGRGTTFKVYLPAIDSAPSPDARGRGRRAMPRGKETVLFVEDEAGVRSLARHVLSACGYDVLEAQDGEEALRIARSHPGRIDLVATDVVMPRLGGRELAEQLAGLHPGAKVLYLSGYTEDAATRSGGIASEGAFLGKPFSPADLAQKVREILDRKPRPR